MTSPTPEGQRVAGLTDAQLAEMGSIKVTDLISPKRISELRSLVCEGYAQSALMCAIREAAYAARHGIIIPPTMENDR